MSPEDKLVKELCAIMALEGALTAIRAYECILRGISPNRVLQVIREGNHSEVVAEAAQRILEAVVDSAKHLDVTPAGE